MQTMVKMLFERPWRWVILLVLIGGALWWGLFASPRLQAAVPPKQAPAVPVRVATARLQSVPLSLDAVGQIQALHQVLVRPQIEGVLTEVLFQEGQMVRKGQLLARLDDRSLRAQQAQAQAELQRLQAQLKLARVDLSRYEGLAAQAAIPGQQRDQQASLVDQLEAQVRSQAASVKAVEVQLSHASITSPITGRAGLRQVDVGNLVRPTDANGLVTVAQTRPMGVVFSLPQTQLPDVRRAIQAPGQARITLADQEQRGAILAQGSLRTIDNRIDPATGSLRLKAEVPNQDEQLWPGQFVAVTLQTGRIDQALVVPAAALQRGLKGTLVWRIVGDQAQAVPVKVQWQNDSLAVLSSGIKPGDVVVVDGHARLKPKARVKVSNAPQDAGA